MKKLIFVLILIILFLGLSFMLKSRETNRGYVKEGNMKITSVFEHNGNIPSKYTCDGQNAAPELIISEVPSNAKSLVLIVDDPDAPMGTWVHWLLYNIPVNTTKIDALNLPPVAKQGTTDFETIGWGGPCPPSGTHRYFFKLYAIDKELDLPQGVTKPQLEKEIKDHILEKAELIGLYKRNK